MSITLDGNPLPFSHADVPHLLQNPAELQVRIAQIQLLVGPEIQLPTVAQIATLQQNPQPLFDIQERLGSRLVVPFEAVEELLDPSTRRALLETKEKCEMYGSELRIGGLAALAFAIAFTVIGIFSLLGGVAGIVIGITLIVISLPLFYAGCNTFIVSRNLEMTSQNMLALAIMNSSSEKLKTTLCKKPFFLKAWSIR